MTAFAASLPEMFSESCEMFRSNSCENMDDFLDLEDDMKDFDLMKLLDQCVSNSDMLGNDCQFFPIGDLLCNNTEKDLKQMMELVSPNDVLPMEVSRVLNPTIDPFINPATALDMHSLGVKVLDGSSAPESSDLSSASSPESFGQINDFDLPFMLSDRFLNDRFLNALVKDEVDLDDIIKEEEIAPVVKVEEEDVSSSEQNSSEEFYMCQKGYHPDYDHCYSKSIDEENNEAAEEVKSWPFVGSPDSSGSSSEEVDVVTVTEELQPPVVPKALTSYRNRRQKRIPQTQKMRNQNSFSSKTLNAAMKRNITRNSVVRRTYRRKINNSVETTPSNSLPSSRCSSDVEDIGKRANHNSSERKRREVLRAYLHNLRECIPNVKSNPKAPKVVILVAATVYITELQRKSAELTTILGKEKNKQLALKAKLKKLSGQFRSFKYMTQKELYHGC